MKYSKVHTCDFADEKCLESGNEFKVCDFHGIKIGVMICYDREYSKSTNTFRKANAYGDLLAGKIEVPFIREGQ